MQAWLTQGLLNAASDAPEELEGFILGRGLPQRIFDEMRIGLWHRQEDPAPDEVYAKRYGPHGEERDGWMSVPIWSPRIKVIGVIYRSWDGSKEFSDYMLPDSKWSPAFIGLTPSVLQRIWEGGDVWVVEGLFDMTIGHVIPKKDVVLGCGTANLSRLQLNFLKRFLAPTAMVHVVFDMDKTGRDHAEGYTDPKTSKYMPGVCDRLLKVGVRCRDVRYRGGKDPGEIWERGGKPALASAFNL